MPIVVSGQWLGYPTDELVGPHLWDRRPWSQGFHVTDIACADAGWVACSVCAVTSPPSQAKWVIPQFIPQVTTSPVCGVYRNSSVNGGL